MKTRNMFNKQTKRKRLIERQRAVKKNAWKEKK